MHRVFWDSNAKLYKAEEPKHKDDAEMVFPTSDHLEHLNETPMSTAEFQERARLSKIDMDKAELPALLKKFT